MEQEAGEQEEQHYSVLRRGQVAGQSTAVWWPAALYTAGAVPADATPVPPPAPRPGAAQSGEQRTQPGPGTA